MGLDTTHDCWHGGYIGFMVWRETVARAAGLPPLMIMEGYWQGWGYLSGAIGVYSLAARAGDEEKLARLGLPLKWEQLKPDPLHVLLTHSDCEGEIAATDCGPIADRLEAILPSIPPAEGNARDWRAATRQFIDGLRRAAAAGEPVEFH